ncbi:MAG: AMP-binding protein [Tepidisphaeraceae bacterium]|jgi:long-chain acyl-CoA synthetase
MLTASLRLQAARRPHELVITDDHGVVTFGQLAAMAGGFAKHISEQTQLPRVGLLLPSSAAFVAGFYGTLLAGKTVVPINFLLSEAEIVHCIRDSGIEAVVTIPQLAGRIEKTGLKIIDATKIAPAPIGGIPTVPTAAADDIAVLMYTSGTSGLPKGVLLSHGNIQSDVDAAIAHMNLQERHKFLGIIPLFHAFGMTAMMLAPIQLGSSIVYMARFSPVGALNAIRKYGISLVLAVPSMYAAILRLKDASAEDFKTIYAMISGGEPLPTNLRDGFETRFGVKLLEAYGMTETSLAIALNTPQSQRAGSVGKPISGVEIRITDDAGNKLPQGEEGEIWVKGPMVMKGYNNLPDETAAALTPDGYFKTGDLGRIDSDGFLFITGRKKDLIIIAGEKASPREIEEMLQSHPAVAEAAVIGKKDPTRGEAVLAFIIPREGFSPTLEELREFCRQSGLAAWKIPKEIRIVPDLPRSATGKVLKRVLARESAE